MDNKERQTGNAVKELHTRRKHGTTRNISMQNERRMRVMKKSINKRTDGEQ